LWFWSTEEEESTAATVCEILTVVNTKITVLLDVILQLDGEVGGSIAASVV
jgi:hypothetical protein